MGARESRTEVSREVRGVNLMDGMWTRMYPRPTRKIKHDRSTNHNSPRQIRDTINGFHKD